MDLPEEVKNVIVAMLKSIVRHPEEIEVYVADITDERGLYTAIKVSVAKSDIAQAIGTGGANADCIRRIALICAMKNNYTKPIYFRVIAPDRKLSDEK